MASTAQSQLLGPACYTWDPPESRIKVRIRLLAIEGLQLQADLVRDSGEGHALGGILTGNTARPGITEVTGFQPVSNLDPESVKRAVASTKSSAVGYYRILVGEELRPTKNDFALAYSSCTHPNSVILLIDASGGSSPKATFFYWDHGAISLPFEFPLDAALLAAAERYERNVTESKTRVRPPSAPAKGAGLRYGLWALVTASILSAGVAGFLRYKQTRVVARPSARSAAPSEATLGFRTDRSGGDLIFSWDRHSPLIANATLGVIVVKSGVDRREIVLRPEQLRNGNVFYTPTSDQLEVQLNVISPDQRISRESVVIVLQGADLAGPHSFATQSLPAPGAASDRIPLSQSAAPAPPQPRKTDPIEVTPEQRRNPARIFLRPPSPAGSAAPLIEEAPSLQAGLDRPVAPLPASLLQPSGVAIPPVPPVTPTPVSSPASPAAVPVAEYHPPEILVKRDPTFASMLSRFFFQPTAVDVRLTIDTTGTVSKAEVVDRQHVNAVLASAAIDAGRMWRFRPARRGEEPVTSEMVVQFRFDPRR